jgi:hypothetical protein
MRQPLDTVKSAKSLNLSAFFAAFVTSGLFENSTRLPCGYDPDGRRRMRNFCNPSSTSSRR